MSMSTAFVGANVIIGDGGSIEDGAVKVEHERIVEVGPRNGITVDRYVELDGRP